MPLQGSRPLKAGVLALQACQASQAAANVPCQAFAPEAKTESRARPLQFANQEKPPGAVFACFKLIFSFVADIKAINVLSSALYCLYLS